MFRKSYKSIKIKVVFIYLILVFIVMIASGTFILMGLRNSEISRAQEYAESYSDFIKKHIIDEEDPSNFDKTMLERNFIMASSTSAPLEGSILSPNGETLASSVRKVRYSNSVIIAAMNGKKSFKSWVVDEPDIATSQEKRWFLYADPILEDDVVKYIVFIRIGADNIMENLLTAAITILFSAGFALALTGVLGMLFASTLTDPIITLTRNSKRLAEGDLHLNLPVKSSDEIGELTESFNQMALNLSSTMEIMTEEKNKLEIVLHNMTDGVLAYDSNSNLIHANYACNELLSIDFETITLFETTNLLGIELNSLEELTLNTVKESTLYVGDKYISSNLTAYLNKYGQIGGVVIVLQDITKHKMLDNMRKEFVANVSHEIRTPLTTIKSYAETLLDGGLDDKELSTEFLTIINGETDRMTLLVKDLLDLSKLDNKDFNIDLKEIDLITLIRRSIVQNKILADMKKQKIIFDPSESKLIINADDSRINQVINNVLTNAIKYSFEGSTIEIFTDETDKYYRLYVKDNGMGIPKEDLSRIFERFYRVDKARSRAMGGTGLGLSIAKQIMEAHGGKISAISDPNKGTTMILRFLKLVN